MGNVFSRKKELSQRVPTMKSKRFNSRHISLNEVTESQSRNVVETDTGLRKINQYKFNSVIGRGSFGEVWLATDDHNISYAIKVLKRSMLRKKRTGMAANALDAGYEDPVSFLEALGVDTATAISVLESHGGDAHRAAASLFPG